MFRKISPFVLCFSMTVGLLVVMETTMAANPEQVKEDVPGWIRGHGQQLELRLSGEITRSDNKNVEGAGVEIQIMNNDHLFESLQSKVDGGRFEAWLPVNKHRWYSITVNATCRDKARGTKTILRHQLREVVIHGLELPVQLPSRQVTVLVEQDGNKVAHATVRAELSNRLSLKSETDLEGAAKLQLLQNEQLSQLTAWSQQPLVGGYFFEGVPSRDPRSDLQVLTMHQCRPFSVVVKDTHGQPISGVEFKIYVTTPPPDSNFVRAPDGFTLITNSDGIAPVAWYPDIKDVYCNAEILDNRWVMESSQLSSDRLEVIAKPAIRRANITGQIFGGGQFVGGMSVKLGTCQAERDDMIDFVYSICDPDGKFTAEVLPDATYAVFLEDDKWVSNPTDAILYDSKVGQQKPLWISLSEGIPVRITLTQGSDRKPISGAWVNIHLNYEFDWFEDDQTRNGSLGRSVSTYANDEGVIEVMAPEGELEASIYLSAWRATQSIDVRRGQCNEIQFHRKIDEVVAVSGQVVPWQEDRQQAASATVHIRAIDGESGDEFRLETDENGVFQIKTSAAKLGVIAYSPDKSFIGTAVNKDFSQPARIQLFPSKSFSGQITDRRGTPIANHKVWASIEVEDEQRFDTAYPSTSYVPGIETQTDSEGYYRLDGLPCLTKIQIRADTLENDPNRFESVDEIYYLPDDEFRSRVTKIDSPMTRDISPLSERFATMHRDCRLGNYHLMVIAHNMSNDSHREFISRHLINDSQHQAVASYMQLQVDYAELLAGSNRPFAEKLDWPNVKQGILACTYDIDGKELGRIYVDPDANDAAGMVGHFIDRYVPVQQDSEAKWNNAFKQAREENKLVWIRIGGRYCGPCFKLNRWIDDQRDVLEKDFVLVKIDGYSDLKGPEVAERLTKGRSVGIPFHAMFDVSERLVADSYGPIGNIGFMSGVEGKRHFKKMLEAACNNITPNEIQALLDTLED